MSDDSLPVNNGKTGINVPKMSCGTPTQTSFYGVPSIKQGIEASAFMPTEGRVGTRSALSTTEAATSRVLFEGAAVEPAAIEPAAAVEPAAALEPPAVPSPSAGEAAEPSAVSVGDAVLGKRPRARFDVPAKGQFSAIYLPDPDGNFASLNAGDYRLYVGGGSINKAFGEALAACGQNPKDRYEILHEALLAQAAAVPGKLQWLRRGCLFPSPAGGAMMCKCWHCGMHKKCWGSTLYQQTRARSSEVYCSSCWDSYETWLFEDVSAFCGLVPEGTRMATLYPVGLVSIAVFPRGRRPASSDRNVAMVYAVGPNCGNVKKGRAVDQMDAEAFLDIVQTIGAAIAAAVVAYNREAVKSRSELQMPRIEIVRICLLSGGIYMHPDVSKVRVAKSLIRGLVRQSHEDEDGDLRPCLDFAWDNDVFRAAWHQLGLGYQEVL